MNVWEGKHGSLCFLYTSLRWDSYVSTHAALAPFPEVGANTLFQLTDKAAEVKEGSMTSQFMVTQLAPWLTVLL